MNRVKHLFSILLLSGLPAIVFSQQPDSVSKKDTIPAYIKGVTPNPNVKPARPADSPYKPDSAARKHHDPRRATLYSTFLPGLGQIYNKKYWKVPLVAAALGIPAYLYFDNKRSYQKAQFAIAVILDHPDSIPGSLLAQVDPLFQHAVEGRNDQGIRSYRNQVRQYQDYSVIFFILFWGLQIVDATVDAHLKEFDVTDQLSLRIAPSSQDMHLSGGGVSLVIDMHQTRPHRLYPNP
ncbi:MAG: DUF5683 domain-containing protein [Bacteroidota bacterium]|nr:DUF5683 domain-containing protein [Bacteroidota bacterium]MDP4216726.1 DUF5683 domain-containing protein [Bacteroidota bacterium]MDP4247491.1 DUF5683 domain-containing protein [Bacteroidota bacterium]MDP4254446.1 DUF5683 domain-containing protein [Bacteroidota bacterium]MDP4259268.1 DUF5683 domain-containing protein [Bacteroidota bacterium]